MMTTIIGRGHSGTRAISHTLSQSGVFMGEPLNGSGDLLPPEAMYEACRIIARHIPWRGGLEWDFSTVQTVEIPRAFKDLIERYLASVLASDAVHKGWKIPETTLCYPWIKRLFPDLHYVFWVRDPRDCIIGHHLTDDLHDFGIEYPVTDDIYLRRSISWKYQNDLVRATGRPARWIKVRFEDFVLHQERELERLEAFYGLPLARIPVRKDPVGRYKSNPDIRLPDFLADALVEHEYA